MLLSSSSVTAKNRLLIPQNQKWDLKLVEKTQLCGSGFHFPCLITQAFRFPFIKNDVFNLGAERGCVALQLNIFILEAAGRPHPASLLYVRKIIKASKNFFSQLESTKSESKFHVYSFKEFSPGSNLSFVFTGGWSSF